MMCATHRMGLSRERRADAGNGEMFDLSGTEECRRVRLGPLLHYLQHDVGAGRLGQAFQFLERAFRIKTPGPARDETYERRTLGLPYSSARHR